jgi:endonuclease I
MRITRLINIVGSTCLYTGNKLPIGNLSVEHVIPRSYSKYYHIESKILNDVYNLHVADRHLNILRQNYTFVDFSLKPQNKHTWTIDSKSKIFCPPRSSRGPIARTIFHMINKYPIIATDIDKVIDKKALYNWMKYDLTSYEKYRNYKLNNYFADK